MRALKKEAVRHKAAEAMLASVPDAFDCLAFAPCLSGVADLVSPNEVNEGVAVWEGNPAGEVTKACLGTHARSSTTATAARMKVGRSLLDMRLPCGSRLPAVAP